MTRFLFKAALRLLPTHIFVLALGVFAYAQAVEIKLLDGRSGRPMSNGCVNVWVGNERKTAMAIPTDENGIARVILTEKDADTDVHKRSNRCGPSGVINPVVKYNDSIRINAGYVLCQSRKADYSWLAIMDFSMGEFLQHGVVTANGCGKATASPKAGEIIIFVRPLTWWEKMKQ